MGKWWEVTLGASWAGSLGNRMYTLFSSCSLTRYPSPGLWASVQVVLGMGNQPCWLKQEGGFHHKGAGCTRGTQRCSPALGCFFSITYLSPFGPLHHTSQADVFWIPSPKENYVQAHLPGKALTVLCWIRASPQPSQLWLVVRSVC